MRKLCAQLVLMVTGMAMVITGCQSPQATPRAQAPIALGQQPTPFLDGDQYPHRLGLAIEDSLRKHGFTRRWIALRGEHGSVSFLAERWHSEHRFDGINVRVAADEHVTASIIGWQFGPSDWAILGKLFVDFRPETELIAQEIASKLSEDKQATKR